MLGYKVNLTFVIEIKENDYKNNKANKCKLFNKHQAFIFNSDVKIINLQLRQNHNQIRKQVAPRRRQGKNIHKVY